MSVIKRIIDHFHPRDRREHVRNLHPHLVLDIDGERYTTINWSLGGLKIAGYKERVRPGLMLRGAMMFESGEQGQFVAEVVDTAEDGFVTMAGLKGI